MKIFSRGTLLEKLADVLVNLSSGWLGVVVITPGIFGTNYGEKYFDLLLKNLPFAIVSLFLALILSEKSRLYEH